MAVQGTGDVHNHFELRDSLRKCHQAFKTSDYEQQKNVNPERAPGTCEWLTKHPVFNQWHQSDRDNLLWVSADPGCGKSVLSRYLVDTWLPNNTDATVCYYFFKDNDEQSSLAPALSAILHQLFCFRHELIESCALPAWNKVGENIAQDTNQMWRILRDFKDVEFNEQLPLVILVMDALDECRDSDRRQLIDLLCRFHADSLKCASKHAALKILVTSRPYESVERWFCDASQQFTNIRLRGEDENDSINREINLVVRHCVHLLVQQFNLSQETKSRLLGTLLQMEHRTYLWLHLAVDHIREALQSSLLPDSVDIEAVPSSVEDAYERILRRIKTAHVPMVKTILQLMISARRPLTVEEMALALTVAMQKDIRADASLIVNVEHVERQIRQWCGLFVFIQDARLYLIHQTAKEFLVRGNLEVIQHESQWRGILTQNECEYVMSRAAVDYLLLDRFRYSIDRQGKTIVRLLPRTGVRESHHFFEYCSLEWTSHFELAQMLDPVLDQIGSTQNDALTKKIVTLCNAGTRDKNFPAWMKVKSQARYRRGRHKTIQTHEFETIHMAAFIGSVAVLQAVHNIQSPDLSVECKIYYSSASEANDTVCDGGRRGFMVTPLTLAMVEDHEPAIRWLIDKGATAGSVLTAHRTSLCVAVLHYSAETIRLLLEAGADGNVSNSHKQTPLLLACRLGMRDIVEMLLNHGTDIHKESWQRGNVALHTAVENGHTSVAEILIERGANVNALNHNLDTPLDVAWNASMVKMLIGKGAIFNQGARALVLLSQPEAREPNKNVDVRYRLKWSYQKQCPEPDVFESAVNSIGNFEFDTSTKDEALLWAAAWGHYRCVIKLLRMKADIGTLRVDGRNALDLAIDNNHQITSALLVEAGASPTTDEYNERLVKLMRGATPLQQIITQANSRYR